MKEFKVKTHTDGIWISLQREADTVKKLSQQIISAGFEPVVQDNNNFGIPYIYQRNESKLNCRLVDSVFQTNPESVNDPNAVIVTDNHTLIPIAGQLISVLPEFWSIWHFSPVYSDRPWAKKFNCFMNRPRPERSIVFYELIKRNLLDQGFVSYNSQLQDYEKNFHSADLRNYSHQHQIGRDLVPYNSVESHGTLEQCIIDSKISLVMETYTSDNHIVFSEKIFRALQLPRPWLLYCSNRSVELLRSYGFDVLDDYVDHSYDNITLHHVRLGSIMDQLETFIVRTYSQQDYERFDQACDHNRVLLKTLAHRWPGKLQKILDQIQQL